jgi:hypothetical protein
MGLSRPSPAVQHLVVNTVELLAHPGVYEGVTQHFGIALLRASGNLRQGDVQRGQARHGR